MHIGDKIRKLRKDNKLTLKELSNKTKISISFISDIENKRRNPSIDTLRVIAKAFDIKTSELLEDKIYLKELTPINADSDFTTIPILGSIRAGQPIWAEDNLQGYMPIMTNNLKKDSIYFGLKVKGDSMNLEFEEGTILVIEKTPCIENGEIGVVRINGFEATVKKIVINNEMITLIPMSNNPEHIPQMYNLKTDDIEIIGKVKQATKTY